MDNIIEFIDKKALLERQRMEKRYTVNKYTFYKVDPSLRSRHQSKRAGVYEDEYQHYYHTEDELYKAIEEFAYVQ